MCSDGVHAYLMRGIHGKGAEGAYSVVLQVLYPHLRVAVYLTRPFMPFSDQEDIQTTRTTVKLCEHCFPQSFINMVYLSNYMLGYTLEKVSITERSS